MLRKKKQKMQITLKKQKQKEQKKKQKKQKRKNSRKKSKISRKSRIAITLCDRQKCTSVLQIVSDRGPLPERSAHGRGSGSRLNFGKLIFKFPALIPVDFRSNYSAFYNAQNKKKRVYLLIVKLIAEFENDNIKILTTQKNNIYTFSNIFFYFFQ